MNNYSQPSNKIIQKGNYTSNFLNSFYELHVCDIYQQFINLMLGFIVGLKLTGMSKTCFAAIDGDQFGGAWIVCLGSNIGVLVSTKM